MSTSTKKISNGVNNLNELSIVEAGKKLAAGENNSPQLTQTWLSED